MPYFGPLALEPSTNSYGPYTLPMAPPPEHDLTTIDEETGGEDSSHSPSFGETRDLHETSIAVREHQDMSSMQSTNDEDRSCTHTNDADNNVESEDQYFPPQKYSISYLTNNLNQILRRTAIPTTALVHPSRSPTPHIPHPPLSHPPHHLQISRPSNISLSRPILQTLLQNPSISPWTGDALDDGVVRL